MALKAKVITGAAATVIAGGAILTWTGKGNLDNVKAMYDSLYQNYQNALTNIGTYRDVLEKRMTQLNDMNQIKEQLLAECNEKDAKIKQLQAELEELQGAGREEDTQRIQELEAQIAQLQEEYDATVDELNTLSSKYNDLTEQLTQANQDAEALEDEISKKDAGITDTAVLTEDQIDSGEDYKLYLTFAKASNSTTDKDISPAIAYLNSQKWFDAKRESPIQIHATGTGGDTTSLYINNVNAFNMITANATEGAVDENTNGVYYPGSGDVYYLVVDSTKYELIKASDNTWTTTFGYETTDNGTK